MFLRESRESPARPSADSLRSKIGVISELEAVTSYQNPNSPSTVTTNLVIEGSGLVGYTKNGKAIFDDRINWSGIYRHISASVAGAVGLGKRLKAKGFSVDLDLLASGMEASHNGRRISDEAGWYRDNVLNSSEIRNQSNESIGLEILKEIGIDKNVYDLVSRLAHGVGHVKSKRHVLEFLSASWTDHCTTDKFQPFSDRMAGFLSTNFFDPNTAKENKAMIYSKMNEIVEKGRLRQITVEEAVEMATSIGAEATSSRLGLKDLMSIVVVESAFEQWLIDLGIDIEGVANDIAKPPRALTHASRMYLNDVEVEAFKRISEESQSPTKPEKWGMEELRRLYAKQKGKPFQGGRSPITIVVTPEREMMYKTPSGKILKSIRALDGRFVKDSKNMLKLKEPITEENRFFIAISQEDFENSFDPETRTFTQNKHKHIVHHAHTQEETTDGSFASAVELASLPRSGDQEMLIIAGTAPKGLFKQFSREEAFVIDSKTLNIDEVFSLQNGSVDQNKEVVKVTRQYLSERSLRGYQRSIDFFEYLDSAPDKRFRRLVVQAQLYLLKLKNDIFNPQRTFVSPTQQTHHP